MYQRIVSATAGSTMSKKAVTFSSHFTTEAVINAVKKYKCDLTVKAAHGRRSMKRLLMGSETMHMLTHSHNPVLVLR